MCLQSYVLYEMCLESLREQTRSPNEDTWGYSLIDVVKAKFLCAFSLCVVGQAASKSTTPQETICSYSHMYFIYRFILGFLLFLSLMRAHDEKIVLILYFALEWRSWSPFHWEGSRSPHPWFSSCRLHSLHDNTKKRTIYTYIYYIYILRICSPSPIRPISEHSALCLRPFFFSESIIQKIKFQSELIYHWIKYTSLEILALMGYGFSSSNSRRNH